MNEYDKVQKRLEAVKQDLARTLVQLETMGALEDHRSFETTQAYLFD